jgi:hypothetical protein
MKHTSCLVRITCHHVFHGVSSPQVSQAFWYVQGIPVHMKQPSIAESFGFKLWEQIGKFSTVKIHQENHINGFRPFEDVKLHGV